MAPVVSDVVASASVRNGKLYIRNRRDFDRQIGQMRDLEGEIVFIRRRATRSVQANRFYWGVVVELLSEHTGYTADEIHELLKAKFIPKRLAICDGNGEVCDEFVLGGSTRAMNKNEFYEYVEAIRRWSAETLDVVIPDPESEAF
jgi:hypothetical protein